MSKIPEVVKVTGEGKERALLFFTRSLPILGLAMGIAYGGLQLIHRYFDQPIVVYLWLLLVIILLFWSTQVFVVDYYRKKKARSKTRR